MCAKSSPHLTIPNPGFLPFTASMSLFIYQKLFLAYILDGHQSQEGGSADSGRRDELKPAALAPRHTYTHAHMLPHIQKLQASAGARIQSPQPLSCGSLKATWRDNRFLLLTLSQPRIPSLDPFAKVKRLCLNVTIHSSPKIRINQPTPLVKEEAKENLQKNLKNETYVTSLKFEMSPNLLSPLTTSQPQDPAEHPGPQPALSHGHAPPVPHCSSRVRQNNHFFEQIRKQVQTAVPGVAPQSACLAILSVMPPT